VGDLEDQKRQLIRSVGRFFGRVISGFRKNRYGAWPRGRYDLRLGSRRALREDGDGGGRIVPTTREFIARIASVLILVLAAACGPNQFGSSQETTVGPGTGRTDGSTEASETLENLKVAPPGSMSGYSRERFPHWSRASDFGWNPPQASCDVREAALIRDGEDVEVGRSCKVSSGTWLDPYTERTYSDPQEIDIDHIVPLAEAWRSGASSWDDEQRERYANDPDVLLSVEDNANQQKGDKGPEAWKPLNEEEWCDYAQHWIEIKAEYELSVDEQEKAALEQMLGTCAVS
jgi:hypothetical protein